jgi:glycosyltransferase involved in cell wall biosynthesis
MLFVRLFSSALVVYVYHEPYTSFASYRAGGFSRTKAIKVTAISIVNLLLCSLSHKIILPSARAYEALPAARSNKERYAKINLFFADETKPKQINQLRVFITYIGTVAEDHAFAEFVQLMYSSIINKTLLPYQFLIATRSKIPDKYSSIIQFGIYSERLIVQSGASMTNNQINYFYSQSFVVWNAYKRSMQSGVLPKAYMFGTPVIVSVSNQSEFFENGVHGALISDQYTSEDFESAIFEIQKNWPKLSENCRNFYLNKFDYRAIASTFINFLSARS